MSTCDKGSIINYEEGQKSTCIGNLPLKRLKNFALFSSLLFFIAISAEAQEEVYDPLEGLNRAVFKFNDLVYVYVLKPVSLGYDAVVPDPVQNSVGNFFTNLRYPSYLVSDLIQLKFKQSRDHTARFLINTTLGIGGLFDVAEHFELVDHYEDFGLALSHSGVPPGPYLVLPFLGPSNIRDAVGTVVDSFLNPIFYVTHFDLHGDTELALTLGLKGLDVVNNTSKISEAVEFGKENSLDYYLFVRSAYKELRLNQLHDGQVLETEFDFEEEEDEAFSESE